MGDPRKGGPKWLPPGSTVAAPTDKPKPAPHDYMTPAMDAVKSLGNLGGPRIGQESIVAAVIIAQAFDRLGEKLIEAAAISQYKRSP